MERTAPLAGPSIRAHTPQDWSIYVYAGNATGQRLVDVVPREMQPRVHQLDGGFVVELQFPPDCPEGVISSARTHLEKNGYLFNDAKEEVA